MRTWGTVMLMMIVSGCVGSHSETAVLDRVRQLAADHAAALAQDGGPDSKATGRALLATLEAGAGW